MEKALQTIRIMLTKRNYVIDIENDNYIIGKLDNDYILIFKDIIQKCNVENMKQKIIILNKLNIHHCIIIYVQSITSMVNKIIDNSLDIKFELFIQDELQYDITEHKFVPHHIKLPFQEALEIKKKYGTKLPTILKSDPVVRFYNFDRGDIIQINRLNDNHIIYRIVK